MRVWRILLLGVGLWACGDDTLGGDPEQGMAGTGPAPQALPADIDALVEARCRECHRNPPLEYAPMPLETWDDFHAESRAGEPYYVGVRQRINSMGFPMPPMSREQLTAAERASFNAWIDEGAPPAM